MGAELYGPGLCAYGGLRALGAALSDPPPVGTRHALVVFGGLQGLEAGVDADPNLEVAEPSVLFDRYVNTCPKQGSRTIRTEVSPPTPPTSRPSLLTISRGWSLGVRPKWGAATSPGPPPRPGLPRASLLAPFGLSPQQNCSRDKLRVGWELGILGAGAHPAAPGAPG